MAPHSDAAPTDGAGDGMLTGRVAVVTGGARGIGAATAAALLAAGASVCVADLDPAESQLTAAAPDRILALSCDLADPAVPARVVQATVRQFGRIDILVNNAGYYWDAPLHRMSDEQFDAMLQIHAVVPFRLIRECLGLWRPLARQEQAEGRPGHRKIVNVSSRAALRGLAGGANYAAGKAALLGLTYSAAKECARLGINVNAVAFGPVSTRFGLPLDAGNVVRSAGHEVALGRPPAAPPSAGPGPGQRKPRPTLSGRAASAQEAAQAIVFLCSPSSDLVNGEVLQVNG
jgi:3-oxoacyl-[acyl-carrier protein] reductase